MKDQVYERKMINFNDDYVENLNRYIIDNIIEAFFEGVGVGWFKSSQFFTSLHLSYGSNNTRARCNSVL